MKIDKKKKYEKKRPLETLQLYGIKNNLQHAGKTKRRSLCK